MIESDPKLLDRKASTVSEPTACTRARLDFPAQPLLPWVNRGAAP